MFTKKFAKGLVVAAALYNVSVLVTFLIPGILPMLGVKLPYSPFWLWLPSLFALFASIVLYLSSRNLDALGSFPYWNGIIRLLFVLASFLLDFQGKTGFFVGLIAIVDIPLGLYCVFCLPKALNKSHFQLLTNKQ